MLKLFESFINPNSNLNSSNNIVVNGKRLSNNNSINQFRKNNQKQNNISLITRNHLPFSNAYDTGGLDPTIMQAVDEYDLNIDIFRSSSLLKKAVAIIIDNSILQTLAHCWSKQSVKIRLDAMMRFVIFFLCIPRISSFMGVGSCVDKIDIDIPINNNNNNNLSSNIEESKLLTVLKYFLTETLSLFQLFEISILENGEIGSDLILDSRRIKLVINLIRLRISPLIPSIITITENLPISLECMSCHILGVKALSDDINITINHVVLNIRGKLGDDILKKDIGQSVKLMTNAIKNYFNWLYSNSYPLQRTCRNIEIITSTPPEVRAWLKGEEYSSPNEIISIYEQKYKKVLTHIPVPLQSFTKHDIDQAKKDIKRERIFLNKNEYNGTEVDDVIYKELNKILTFISGVENNNNISHDNIININNDIQEKINNISLNNIDENNIKFKKMDSVINIDKSKHRNTIHLELLNLVYNYILIASSRTVAGGDAFFILEDLYGGEGLMICPCKYIENNENKLINIAITASGVKVTLIEHYNLFVRDSVTLNETHPLVKFICSTTTLFALSLLENISNSIIDTYILEDLYKILLSSPESIIHRAISIEPIPP